MTTAPRRSAFRSMHACERVVEASRRLFQQSPTTSIADVAAAAGVSRSTVYRRFPDREILLTAADDKRLVAAPASSSPRCCRGNLVVSAQVHQAVLAPCRDGSRMTRPFGLAVE
jgi:AcrR family transcriptional regulator